ncbi:U-box domain-containing protein 10-like [Brachypodium distachyon]|uniref:RING-type E3 ubiquitin transferase n=1 Tax=Brachypodium distachyon TaxID=15368 RepID=I1IWV6_BRADI|nr:U-box domain-containing protein 10-like [Brachypodium distachyon]KQJ82169.1 hypothetical protein BRADI_5g07120v3 [Brachypodium distachyon]|eukprot:XP_024311425.1 U-box domain-containing protein 10-like [Brachypodium distachyon]
MDGGGRDTGGRDWSEEGIDEVKELGLRRRSRTASSSPPPLDPAPARILASRRQPPPPGPRPSGVPLPPRLQPLTFSEDAAAGSSREYRQGDFAWVAETVSRLKEKGVIASSSSDGSKGSADMDLDDSEEETIPGLTDQGGGGSCGAGGSRGSADLDLDWVEETISRLRDEGARPRLIPPDTSTSSGSELAFSFPPVKAPPDVVDAAVVLDHFAAPETPPRTANTRSEFLEATMEATAGARTVEIKKELLLNRKVLDLAGLERWLRRLEAVAELAWFTELCSDEKKEVPPVELSECAFRALQAARSNELHHGADARRSWIGSVAVPDFFLCPVSKKVMENPVVITSGKTVDHSALEEWWNTHKHICPVTGEVLKHSISIPDVLIALCISWWRTENGIRDLTAATDPPAISPEEEALFREVAMLAHTRSSFGEDYEAILCLHKLVDKEQCSFLHLIGHSPGTITILACVLPETCLDPNPKLDNIILEIIAKAASYSTNKEVLGDDRYAIPVLIARALLGPVPMRAKCAQILGLLADNHYNKIKIGELGGFAAMMELLLVGDIDVKKTVAMALANLCEARENWSRFVREGVGDAAISLLRNDMLVEEAYSILLRAKGFQLAMEDILQKLASFHDEEKCQAMVKRLWDTFVRSEPGQRGCAPETSSSSSSEVSMEDVQAIVSWLQKKSYFSRTYKYRS